MKTLCGVISGNSYISKEWESLFHKTLVFMKKKKRKNGSLYFKYAKISKKCCGYSKFVGLVVIIYIEICGVFYHKLLSVVRCIYLSIEGQNFQNLFENVFERQAAFLKET